MSASSTSARNAPVCMGLDGHRGVPDRRGRRLAATALALLAASAGALAQDVEGSKDPPLVPRVSGAVVRLYDVKRLDAYLLPLGPATASGFARSESVRGRVTFVLYQLAPDCSVLEAWEHYAAVLGRAGFKTLFACEGADCGREHGPDDGFRHPYWSGEGERQITARLQRRGGDVYASVHLQAESPASARAWVTVVEAGPGTGPTGSGGASSGLSPRVEVRSTGPADPVRSGPDAIWQAEIAVTLWDTVANRPAPSGRVLLDGADAGPTGGLVRAVARRGPDGRTRLPAGAVRVPGQPDLPFEIPLRPLTARAELESLNPTGAEVVAEFSVKAWPGTGPEPARPAGIDGRVVVGGAEIGRLDSRLRAVAPRPAVGSPTFPPGVVSAPGYADAPFAIPLQPPSAAGLPALSTRVKLVSAGPAGPAELGPDAAWQAEISVSLWDETAKRPSNATGRVALDGADAGRTGGPVRVVARRVPDGSTRLPSCTVAVPGYADLSCQIPLRALAAKAELRSLRSAGGETVAELVVRAWTGAAARPLPVDGQVVVGGVEVGRTDALLRVPLPGSAEGLPVLPAGLVSAPGHADAPFTIPPPSSPAPKGGVR